MCDGHVSGGCKGVCLMCVRSVSDEGPVCVRHVSDRTCNGYRVPGHVTGMCPMCDGYLMYVGFEEQEGEDVRRGWSQSSREAIMTGGKGMTDAECGMAG